MLTLSGTMVHQAGYDQEVEGLNLARYWAFFILSSKHLERSLAELQLHQFS